MVVIAKFSISLIFNIFSIVSKCSFFLAAFSSPLYQFFHVKNLSVVLKIKSKLIFG
ncbi:hypothetical protein PUN28_007532 [Cardiocondyla obscurior]|uniref:Uncharacterized protein n=1 Tax=Cardiocondyla obscurior TaxID=286306 RepID=A0AAW2G6R2_9HYME